MMNLKLATLFLIAVLASVNALGNNEENNNNQTLTRSEADNHLASLFKNEPIQWLKNGNEEFLSLYFESGARKNHGGIVLLHGQGVHPKWPGLISEMEQQLPQNGWAVLSLSYDSPKLMLKPPSQTPSNEPLKAEELANTLDASGKNTSTNNDSYLQRIDSAVNFFSSKGFQHLFIIGFDQSTSRMAYYASHNTNHPSGKSVKGLVFININDLSDHENIVSYLPTIKTPIFDIGYTSHPEITKENLTRKRQQLFHKTHSKYRYRTLTTQPSSTASPTNDDIIKSLRGWLHSAKKAHTIK